MHLYSYVYHISRDDDDDVVVSIRSRRLAFRRRLRVDATSSRAMSRRGVPRGRARALPPAVDDDADTVDVAPVDDVDRNGGRGAANVDADGIDSRRRVTTQKFIDALGGAGAGAALAEDVAAACARAYARACAARESDEDTVSDASDETRGTRWSSTPLTLSKSAVEEVTTATRLAEERGDVPRGTLERSDVRVGWKVHVSETLTRWRGAGTILLTPPPETLLCNRCGDVAAEPMIDASGRLFCLPCGRSTVGKTRASSFFGVNPEKQKGINELVVMCCNAATPRAGVRGESLHWKFAADGCRGVFRLGDVAAHEKTCDFALVRCGYPSESWNRAEKCQEVRSRRAIEEHRATCTFRTVKCPDCERSVQVRKMRAHALVCGSTIVFCPYRRCKWRGKRDEVDAHVATECPAHPLTCGLVDSETGETCREGTPRERIEEHRAACQFQVRPCEYCGTNVSLRRMGDHKLNCAAREFQCPLCLRVMPEEQRETHEKNGCPSVESACEHERFGCAVKVSKEEYRTHAVEHFQHHVKHVAFGPAGVYDLIKEPTEDQIDTLDLLKLMRTRREEMEFDFEQFEALCAKTTENIVSAADQAESFSHDPNNLNAETRLFKACAVKERAAAEFSLREKLSFDRDDEYNDLIISRNLAGSYLVDEMRRLQEKMRALQTMSREARVVLDEKWDEASKSLEHKIDSSADAADVIAAVRAESAERIAELEAGRRRHERRLLDMKSSLLSAKSTLVDNIEHRKRVAKDLTAKLGALARVEKL